MAEESSHKIRIYDQRTRVTGSHPALILPEFSDSDNPKEEDAPISRIPEEGRQSRLTTIENSLRNSTFLSQNNQAFSLVSFGLVILFIGGFFFYSYLSDKNLEKKIEEQNMRLQIQEEELKKLQDEMSFKSFLWDYN